VPRARLSSIEKCAQSGGRSYTVVNHWPQRVSEQRTLYLNQFTGQTIANATAAEDVG